MAPDAISLLSAGAVKPGLTKVVETFRRASHHAVAVTFATAPSIIARIDAGEAYDIVIAPPAVLDGFKAGGKIATKPAVIGRIGVGVMVRAGTPSPNITTVDDFKQSLEDAGALVYNQASTGVYLESLLERLGTDAKIKAKSTRYPDFAAVLDHMRKARSGELGFGATTVIVENLSQGVTFVGPLPGEIQHYTIYAAGLTTTGETHAAAPEFLDFLGSPESRSLFAAAGIA